MKQGVIEGNIRKRESLREIKDRLKQPLPAFLEEGEESVSPEPVNPVKKYCTELKEIDVLKQKHLTPPKPKGSLMFKLSNVLIILLLILAGFLLFVGGYIVSYINSAGPVVANSNAGEIFSTSWRKPKIIDAKPVSDFTPPPVYEQRQQILKENNILSNDLIAQGENRSRAATRHEVKRLANTELGKGEGIVRKIFGNTLGNIFNPFAKTVAQGAVGNALNQELPESGSGAAGGQAGAGQSAQGAAASAQSGQAEGSGQTATAAPAAQKALFALQLQTFPDSAQAFNYAEKLKANGYDAAYVVRGREGDNIVFTVRIGNFESFGDASSVRKVLNVPSQVVVASPNDDFVKF